MYIIQPEQKYLIQLLSSVLHEVQPENPPENLDWEKLYKLSVWHNVANLAFYGINRLKVDKKPPEEGMRKFLNEYKKAVAREATQYIAAEQILRTFEDNNIASMTLKGCIVKYLYPCPDMRLMADIDILFKTEQSNKVKDLMLGLGFTLKQQGGNHDVYYRKPFISIEMHRRLVSENSPYSGYLNETWERACLKPGCKCTYELSNEDFYIYLLIHLTKHYANGGTGIRSFMDIWVYNNRYKVELDWDYIRKELDKIGLREFAENIRGLSEAWFGNAPNHELYVEMADYIFSSGTYGTNKYSVISSMNMMAGRKHSIKTVKHLYRLKLFFPPLSTMIILYPFLEARPFLLPVCWVLRGIRCLIFKRKYTFQIINKVHSVSEEDLNRIENLHKKAGLMQ